MSVEISFDASGTSPEGVPIYHVGETVRGRLTMTPEGHAHTRGLQLRIDCNIHGSGTAEQVVVLPEAMVYAGDLVALEPIHVPFEATLPADGPLSYQGRRIKFDWAVHLRVDVPFWADQRLAFPFLVVPRRAGQPSVWDRPAAAPVEETPAGSIWDDTPDDSES